MTFEEFRSIDVGFEVQKSFANKLLSNKTVAKGLIDNNSATLLDNLYKLLKTYVKNENIDTGLSIFHI